MTKWGSALAFTILIVFSLALTACAGSSGAPKPTPNTSFTTSDSTAVSPTATPSAPASPIATTSAAALVSTGGHAALNTSGANQVIVKMAELSYLPKDITVSAGTTIVWQNTSKLPHTVDAVDGSYKSGNVVPGATFTHTFNTPGIYLYYCIYHGKPGGQGMFGTVIVTAAP
jgi:plastocyanin